MKEKSNLGGKYWPCAPDGFIPNSLVRYVVAPPPPTPLPEQREVKQEILPMIWKKKLPQPRLDFDFSHEDVSAHVKEGTLCSFLLLHRLVINHDV